LRVGPAALHLDLLAIFFFFVAGLELKREFVAGDLRDPRRGRAAGRGRGRRDGGARARLRGGDRHGRRSGPGGLGNPHHHRHRAFALAVISTHLPSALRVFLLTLAVVDDLLAIVIIAVFYTSSLHWAPLLALALPTIQRPAAPHAECA
jgi:Na+:H+ antiporter, NhaA family